MIFSAISICVYYKCLKKDKKVILISQERNTPDPLKKSEYKIPTFTSIHFETSNNNANEPQKENYYDSYDDYYL